jgi:hypothetical protein
MSKTTAEREKQIRDLLSELERSGESVKAFAKRQGVSAWTIYQWRRRYGSRPAGHKRPTKSGFIAVKVPDKANSAVSFEVVVGGATTLRVPMGFDEAELTRLIRVLRAC